MLFSKGFIYYDELLYYFYRQSMLFTINEYPEEKMDKKDQALEILKKEENYTKKKLKKLK